MPGWKFFLAQVMTPASTRSTTPSENISVWMPRSFLCFRNPRMASGTEPMPSCRQSPSLMSSAQYAADLLVVFRYPGWLQDDGPGVALHDVVDLRDMDEGITERPGHVRCHLCDHELGALRSGLGVVDRYPEGTEPVLVRLGDHAQGHIDRQDLLDEQPAGSG